MNFDEMLEQVLALVQRQGRVSYRALKRRFDLDDIYLEGYYSAWGSNVSREECGHKWCS